jgi:hypothetical protein
MDIWTIWQPDYALQALTKVATAAISLTTAIALWPLIPRALKIPSVQQLQSVIAELKAEVGRRLSTEDQLAATHRRGLEQRSCECYGVVERAYEELRNCSSA